MESLVIGRRFFQRMTKPSDAWRRAWRDLGQDETNLKPKDYKNICSRRFCLQYIEQVNCNWRAGSYELKTNRYESIWGETGFEVGEDFTVGNRGHTNVQIFDRKSCQITK